jgi:hypothetical protein
MTNLLTIKITLKFTPALPMGRQFCTLTATKKQKIMLFFGWRPAHQARIGR